MQTEYLFTQQTYFELQKRRILFYSLIAFFGIVGVILFAVFYPLTDYNKLLVLEFVPTFAASLIGVFYDIAIIFMIVRLKNVKVRFVHF